MKLEINHSCLNELILIDNHQVNDCSVEFIKEALCKAVNKIKNKDTLIELLQDCIEWEGKELVGFQCDDCGEWNYTKTLKV